MRNIGLKRNIRWETCKRTPFMTVCTATSLLKSICGSWNKTFGTSHLSLMWVPCPNPMSLLPCHESSCADGISCACVFLKRRCSRNQRDTCLRLNTLHVETTACSILKTLQCKPLLPLGLSRHSPKCAYFSLINFQFLWGSGCRLFIRFRSDALEAYIAM